MAPIITYLDNIRESVGMNTVVFSCNTLMAEYLSQNLSKDFTVIHANLDNIDSDKYEWIEEALHRSHILILDNDSDNFIVGFLSHVAKAGNPIHIMAFNLPDQLKLFVDAISEGSANYFISLKSMMREINEY